MIIEKSIKVYNVHGDLITDENKIDHVVMLGSVSCVEDEKSDRFAEIQGSGISGSNLINNVLTNDQLLDHAHIVPRVDMIVNLIESGGSDEKQLELFSLVCKKLCDSSRNGESWSPSQLRGAI